MFVCYRYADRMLRVLGETGTSVLVRLSAFIVLCIGVQIVWTGASTLLATLPARHVALRTRAGGPRVGQTARPSAIIYSLASLRLDPARRDRRAIPVPV